MTEALIAASGVRRSCETAERMAARSSLPAARAPAVWASASSSSCASDEASSLANASRIRCSSALTVRPEKATSRPCSISIV